MNIEYKLNFENLEKIKKHLEDKYQEGFTK